jgi:type IV pilus assembly protein PilC
MLIYPKVFPQLLISMVKAGEESGSISQSLATVGQQMEKTSLLQKKIKGAMMYPGIILSVMIIIAVLMMIYVVPTLVDTFKSTGAELPWTTRFVINISDLFRYHSVLVLSIIILLVVAFVFCSKQEKGKRILDALWLKIPIVGGLVREINAARTARTLSSLLSSGVDMLLAIQITESVVQNSYFKDVIARAMKVVQNGEAISGVFLENQKLFPSFIGEMMSVGEETGKLAPMLMDVAIYYENEVDQRTKDMSTIIEPFMMVMIGAAVGFFAVAMISPMYSVLNNI